MIQTGIIVDGQVSRTSMFACSVPSIFEHNTKVVPVPFNGIFVDIGNVVYGSAPSVDWRALYHYLLTEVMGAPEESRFDCNICFYNVKSEPEQDAAQKLQRATGAATAASSLQKNDTDIQLAAKVRLFIDRFVSNGAKPPYGHVVLVTGDSDVSELVEFAAVRGFIPLAVSFSDRISHALVQKIYECRGYALQLDRFVEQQPIGRSVPHSFASSPRDIDPVLRGAQVRAFPKVWRTPFSFADRPAGWSAKASGVPAFSAPFSPSGTAGRDGAFSDGAESVPDFDERDGVQDFVAGLVLEQIQSDIALGGLDQRIMRTVTGLWINGKTPTFSHTVETIAARCVENQETVAQHLHQLLVDELLVTRELHYQRAGMARVSQALVPTRRGVAASRLAPGAVPKS